MLSRETALLVVAGVVTLALVAFAFGAAPATRMHEYGPIVVSRLDPKTEGPAEDRDRTDSRFFHGQAILKQASLPGDDPLRAELLRLGEDAKRLGTQPLVREGDYGARISGSRTEQTDFVFCFHCRTPLVRVPDRDSSLEREINLAGDQAARLKKRLDFALATPRPTVQKDER
jgi:hypothetical protein